MTKTLGLLLTLQCKVRPTGSPFGQLKKILTMPYRHGNFFSAVALATMALTSFSLADTIYFKNGSEIKNVFVSEITPTEIKYKQGERAVVYLISKKDALMIIYNDGTKDIFAENAEPIPSQTSQNGTTSKSSSDYESNFTGGQRFGTWALNAFVLSGIGSWTIMGDVGGGFMHLGLGIAGGLLIYNSIKEECSYSYYYGDDCEKVVDENLFSLGVISLGVGAFWNIIRSATYDKPKNYAVNGNASGFNFAILPNKQGNASLGMFYKRSF